MKNSILGGFAALLLSGSAVVAADAYDRKAGSNVKEVKIETASEKSWTGIWLGAFGGYGISNTELSLDHVYGDGSPGYNKGKVDGLGGEGLFGELQLGADKQIGQFVVGVYGFVGMSGSETTFNIGGVGEVASVEEQFGWGGAIRIGKLLNSNNLLYVAGGYREVDVDINIIGNPTQEETFSGFFGEVGLESRLTSISDNAYLRIAGRYTVFDDKTWSGKSGASDPCWDELNADPGKLEVMGGLLFKVGGKEVGLD